MQELVKIIMGVVVLALGIPIGNYLAKITLEEIETGRKWFNFVIFLSIIGAVVSLFFRNDVLLFSFLFIALATSRSLKNKSN